MNVEAMMVMMPPENVRVKKSSCTFGYASHFLSTVKRLGFVILKFHLKHGSNSALHTRLHCTPGLMRKPGWIINHSSELAEVISPEEYGQRMHYFTGDVETLQGILI